MKINLMLSVEEEKVKTLKKAAIDRGVYLSDLLADAGMREIEIGKFQEKE